MELFVKIALAAVAIVILASFYVYLMRVRKRHSRACFDAMLRMLLQPTSANIAALDKLLKERWISDKSRHELLHQAEVEADCLSIMPTGELRSSQPFLQQRYSQILATSERHVAVSQLVKTRLTSFRSA